MFVITLTLSIVFDSYLNQEIANFNSDKYMLRRAAYINIMDCQFLAVPLLVKNLNNKNKAIRISCEYCLTKFYMGFYKEYFIDPNIEISYIKNEYYFLFKYKIKENNIVNINKKIELSHYYILQMVIDQKSTIEISKFIDSCYNY